MLPVILDLTNKKCVVVGGGKIAYRKVLSIMDSSANILVISPEVCEELILLQKKKAIHVVFKEVELADFQDAFLIIAATSSKEINQQIARHATNSQLVNVASAHELGNVQIPATLKRGKLLISISTGGASPTLAKRIKKDLSTVFDESYSDYLDFLFEARQLIINSHLNQVQKNEWHKEILNERYKNHTLDRNDLLEKLNEFLS